MSVELIELLKIAVKEQASDIYLKADTPPIIRKEGNLIAVSEEKLSPEFLEDLAWHLMGETQKRKFLEYPEVDLIYGVSGVGRFRANIYKQRGTVGIVMRRVELKIPTFEELHLPEVMKELVMSNRGLILITGATGTGKSSTLAAMIDYRNANKEGHIITIEDPIEFIHNDKKSIISQREVGIDTNSFSEALRYALRQSPDVIVIGEMRDRDSVQSAIFFAETGHLVLSTLHSVNTNQTLERIMQFFPPESYTEIYFQLSLNLLAIFSQRLIPKIGGGRVPAVEVLLASPRIKDLIRRGETDKIKETIEASTHEGMQTFDQHLFTLYEEGLITMEDALRYADSRNDLRLRIKGFSTK